MKINLGPFNRYTLIQTLERCGVNIHYNAPYAAKSAKVYPLVRGGNSSGNGQSPCDPKEIESILFIRFGEFKYNILIGYERASI